MISEEIVPFLYPLKNSTGWSELIVWINLTRFMPMFCFYTPGKQQKPCVGVFVLKICTFIKTKPQHKFSDVFRGYRNGTLG